jgi:hypothetical protein
VTPHRAVLALALALAAVAAPGCARKLAPSGGPRDVSAPLLLATSPDSGAVGVDTAAAIRLTFSEPMDRASVRAATIAPGVRSGPSRAAARCLPAGEAAGGRSGYVVLAAGARDVRGNVLERRQFHFTTGVPPG